MRLYLSGGGSKEQNIEAYKSFTKNIIKSNKPLLYVPLAFDETKYDSCYKWFKDETKYFNNKKFIMVKSSLELSKMNLFEFCGVFIGGGNTYKLLKELKLNGNMEKIINYLENNGVVYGGSAGAIIFGKDIDGCKLSDKKIEVDTSGFNLLNGISLLCHFNESNFEKNKNYLKEYTKNKKLIYLPEEDVIYINGKKVVMYGNKKYAMFENGEYTINNKKNLAMILNNEKI